MIKIIIPTVFTSVEFYFKIVNYIYITVTTIICIIDGNLLEHNLICREDHVEIMKMRGNKEISANEIMVLNSFYSSKIQLLNLFSFLYMYIYLYEHSLKLDEPY